MEDKDLNKKSKEQVEDTTKYGEFVSSLFSWVSPKEQKKRANELENKTKNKYKK